MAVPKQELSNIIVDVIIPVYNSGSEITKTIDSIFCQEEVQVKLIFIDDNSSDNSINIIEAFCEGKSIMFEIISNKSNIGAGLSRNKGIASSSNRYLAFCDSDDVWHPRKLIKQIDFMSRNGLDFSCTGYNEVYTSSLVYRGVKNKIRLGDLTFENPIGCSTVLVDQNRISDLFFSDLRKRQDWAAWIELLKRGYNCGGIDEPLVSILKRNDSLSSNKITLIPFTYKIYRNHFSHNVLISFGMTIIFILHYLIKKHV